MMAPLECRIGVTETAPPPPTPPTPPPPPPPPASHHLLGIHKEITVHYTLNLFQGLFGMLCHDTI